MKLLFISVVLWTATGTCVFAQQDLYPLELRPMNIFDDADYTIEATKTSANTFEFKIKYSGELKDNKTNKEIEFVLSPLTESSFLSSFKRKLRETYEFAKKYPGGVSQDSLNSEQINVKILRLLDFFKYGEQTVELYNDAPYAGELRVDYRNVYVINNPNHWKRNFKEWKKSVSLKRRFFPSGLYRTATDTVFFSENKKEAKQKYYRMEIDSAISNLEGSINLVQSNLNIEELEIDSLNNCIITRLLEIHTRKEVDSVIKLQKEDLTLQKYMDDSKRFQDSINRFYIEMGNLHRNSAGQNQIVQLDSKIELFELFIENTETKIRLIQSDYAGEVSRKLNSLEIANLISGTNSDINNNFSNLRESNQIALDSLIELNRKTNKVKADFIDSIIFTYKDSIAFDLPNEVSKFKIYNVEIEFNDGYIENIVVIGELVSWDISYDGNSNNFSFQERNSGERLVFRNYFPLGFSRKKDIERLLGDNYKIPLFAYDPEGKKYFLPSSFLTFDQSHVVNRRDYSPKDDVVRIERVKEEFYTTRKLYKDETFRLLEVGVFTDFVGFDSKKPNGLVQLDIKRKTNLMTHRFRGFIMPGFTDRRGEWNWGVLSYITPTLSISKIENQNRQLALNKRKVIQNNTDISRLCATTLALKRHEFLFLGIELNTFLFDFPLLKSTLHVNNAIGYGGTALVDSTDKFESNQFVNTSDKKEYIGNSFQYTPSISWEIKGDERYNFSLSYRPTLYYLHSDKITQTAYLDDFLNSGEFQEGTHLFHSIQFFGTLALNKNVNRGKFFFRYRYNWQQNFGRTGFHQAQLGYSVFLLGRNNNFRKIASDSFNNSARL